MAPIKDILLNANKWLSQPIEFTNVDKLVIWALILIPIIKGFL